MGKVSLYSCSTERFVCAELCCGSLLLEMSATRRVRHLVQHRDYVCAGLGYGTLLVVRTQFSEVDKYVC